MIENDVQSNLLKGKNIIVQGFFFTSSSESDTGGNTAFFNDVSQNFAFFFV